MNLRFVILMHTGYGEEHFDMMFQTADALATWQFSTDPTAGTAATGDASSTDSADQPQPLPCRRIQDHRPAYLDYEGPVSAGRGTVSRCEHGQYRLIESDAGRWLIELRSSKLVGKFELRCQTGDNWEFRRMK